MKSVIHTANRIIIKVGSSLVTNDGRGLDHNAIARWAAQIAALRALGKEVVLVSSGAIAACTGKNSFQYSALRAFASSRSGVSAAAASADGGV